MHPASWRHLPVVQAGFLLSFSTYSTTKETARLRPALMQYLSGRAERERLLVRRHIFEVMGRWCWLSFAGGPMRPTRR